MGDDIKDERIFTWQEDNVTMYIMRYSYDDETTKFLEESAARINAMPRPLEAPPYRNQTFWYCGYASFPKKPLPRTPGYDGMLTFVPVHGGWSDLALDPGA